jgi:recombinational DNA repair protein RecT
MEHKQKLEETPALEMVEREDVKERFCTILRKMHGMDDETCHTVYERESLYFKQALRAESKLQNCTGISRYSAFLEIAVLGISLQPGAKSEAYLEPRSSKIAENMYVSTCYLRITAYGELNLRIRSGQIVRMSNPQVIYEGDVFQPRTNERGDLVVDYRPAIPRKSKKIIGCYVCIVTPHDGRDFKWLLEDDIARLKGYSARGFNKTANALYSADGGQIDVGFLEAKTIKHAMRAYTKLRVSDNVVMDDDDDRDRDIETADVAKETQKVSTNDAAESDGFTGAPNDGNVIVEDLSDVPF